MLARAKLLSFRDEGITSDDHNEAEEGEVVQSEPDGLDEDTLHHYCVALLSTEPQQRNNDVVGGAGEERDKENPSEKV